MMTSEEERETIPWREGWRSHRQGYENNPYDEHTQAISHDLWTSGWCARFAAVKHDTLGLQDQEWT